MYFSCAHPLTQCSTPLGRAGIGRLVSGPLKSRAPCTLRSPQKPPEYTYTLHEKHNVITSAFPLGIKMTLPCSFNPAKTSTHPIRGLVASLGPFPLWNSFPHSFLKSLEPLLPSGVIPSSNPAIPARFHCLPVRYPQLIPLL